MILRTYDEMVEVVHCWLCVLSFPDVMMPAYNVSRWWAAFYIVYISLELFLIMNLVSTFFSLTQLHPVHSLANCNSCPTPAKNEDIEYLLSWPHRN